MGLYQQWITLQCVLLHSNSSKLCKGVGHNWINVLQVLSSECALSTQHPLVECLTQWKVKLDGKVNVYYD